MYLNNGTELQNLTCDTSTENLNVKLQPVTQVFQT
jgi:hypothetical protein